MDEKKTEERVPIPAIITRLEELRAQREAERVHALEVAHRLAGCVWELDQQLAFWRGMAEEPLPKPGEPRN